MTVTAQSIAAALFASAVLSGVAFGQAKSDGPIKSVRVSGRITDHDSIPIRHKSVSVGLCKLGEQENSRTDETGFFNFPSIRANRLCDLTIGSGTSSDVTVLGRLEIVDGLDVDFGNLVLESSPKRELNGRLSGPVTVTSRSSSANSKVALAVTRAPSIVGIFVGVEGTSIIQNDGKVFQAPKEKGQVGCSSPQISENDSAVGWLVDSDFCCTSYPLSLLLVVYRPGKPMRRFQGDGRAIFGWHFVAGGKQVAFYQSFPHGDLMTHFEMRDVETERLIGKWDEDSTGKVPGWVQGFDKK